MNNPGSNICVVLKHPIAYSETFLRAHIERLSAKVIYHNWVPVDTANAYPIQTNSDRADKLKQGFKASLYDYVINPAKKVYLQHFLRTNNVKVVLAEYGETGVGVMGICKRLKIPLVVHFHGYDAYQNQVLDRHRETYKKMFAFSSAIIVVSKHMYDQLVKLGAPREKVFYNPCGIDLTKFKQACLASSPLHVLAVGRFVEKKAPYLTILAFKKVLDALPKAKLIMAGEGELYDVCHQIAKSLRIEHAVELRGAVTHEEVASLMQQSRIFVQHSLVPGSGDSEGTPVGILEAGASGLPIVSTKHAGIIDAVRDGETGFLVNEGDIDAMYDYMHRLLSNPELAVEMGRRGREHIRNNFNITTSIKNLRDILDKCSL